MVRKSRQPWLLTCLLQTWPSSGQRESWENVMVFWTQADPAELSNTPTPQKHLTLIINVIVDCDECAHMFTIPASGNLCILNTNLIFMTVHCSAYVSNCEYHAALWCVWDTQRVISDCGRFGCSFLNSSDWLDRLPEVLCCAFWHISTWARTC